MKKKKQPKPEKKKLEIPPVKVTSMETPGQEKKKANDGNNTDGGYTWVG